MGAFGNLFGDGQERLPPEELHKQLAEHYQENPGALVEHGTNGDDPMMASPGNPLEKQEEEERAKHKSEFPWLFDPSRGVRWDFDPIQLRNLAQENTWVGTLVQTITKEVAQTPWTIVDADEETRPEVQKRLETHPEKRRVAKDADDSTADEIADLLSDPNPDHNWTDLAEMWMADLLEIGSLAGVKAYPESAYDGDELTNDDALPLHIKPTAPEVFTKDYRSKTGVLNGYWQFDKEQRPGSSTTTGGFNLSDPIFFDRSEMIWDDMSPRTNRRYGMPPTLLVKDFLQLLDLTVEQEQQYFSKGSIPSGAWVFENWDREQVREWKAENEENVKGKPHKSLMFAGRGGDVRFEPMSFNWQELQFLERVRWYARVISSAFQVPTAVVGLEPEQINYHTFQGERGNFEENTLGPYLQQLERVINDQFVWEHWGRGYRFEFVPGISESTRQQVSERVRSEFKSGLKTRNEARRALGDDPVDEEEDGFKDEVVDEPQPEGPAPDETVSVTNDRGESVDVPTAESVRKDFSADVFRVRLPDDHDGDGFEDNIVGIGVDFPNDAVYVDWRNEVFPDALDSSHVSIYGSVDDLENATGNVAEPMDSLDATTESELAASVVESAAGDSGNSSKSVRKDDPLRETDDWATFDVQPSDVEEVRDEIAEDIDALWDEVLSDDELESVIDRFAAEEDSDETEKSLTGLSRELKRIFDDSDLVEQIESKVRDLTTEKARETLESVIREEGEDIDVDPVIERIENREMTFADDYSERIESDIRDVVSDGWDEGRNSFEIKDELENEAEDYTGWQAERVARQELQLATGEARSGYAAETGRVEVWQTSEDDRVRSAHSEMKGAWKRPSEVWEVEYEERGGVKKENVPGDSRYGIGCRCMTLLRDISEVDDADHAGVSG